MKKAKVGLMLERFCQEIVRRPFLSAYGKVLGVRRDFVRAAIAEAKIGAICSIEVSGGSVPVEIVGLDPKGHVAMPLDDLGSVRLGDKVRLVSQEARVPVGMGMLGQIIDSVGCSYETGKVSFEIEKYMPLHGTHQNPMDRSIIDEPLDLGIRSINSCLTCGRGQRQGIFAGSGVGKSVLLGMMARYTSADVVVIGLIGERGREVKEFLEKELGPEARKKTVVVVETSDKSAIRRTRGAYVAVTVSEYFREQGKQVLLLMDSLTRFAMAQREIGIAAGEPPTTKGYPPSVYSTLSRLVERAGHWGEKGSITGLYTVLVEGDDMDDPVADSARSILDGHIVLSRKIANRGFYPAVDVLSSVSRVMDQVVSKEQIKLARRLKENLALYEEKEDIIHYGEYKTGTDPRIDESIEKEPLIRQFLRQDRDECASLGQSMTLLEDIFPGA